MKKEKGERGLVKAMGELRREEFRRHADRWDKTEWAADTKQDTKRTAKV